MFDELVEEVTRRIEATEGREDGNFLAAGILMIRDQTIGGVDTPRKKKVPLSVMDLQVAEYFTEFCDEMIKIST